MMYGLWRVAGREQKEACGIPPARWVWSEDLELFKFLFTKTWLGGGVVWFSGKWSDRSAGDLLQGLSGQLCEGRKNRHFDQTNCYCFPYMWLLVGPLKKSLEGTEGKISHLSFFRVRKQLISYLNILPRLPCPPPTPGTPPSLTKRVK